MEQALRIPGSFLVVLALASASHAQVTQRVSVDSFGRQAEGDSGLLEDPSFSIDGRFVAFDSGAANLIPPGASGTWHVFVRDRRSGSTEIVSVDSTGRPGNNYSYAPSISADGRYVVFHSSATNLIPDDTNGSYDIFLRDRLLGTTERVSIGPEGVQANSDSFEPVISADGTCVAFASFARNLTGGHSNTYWDTFVFDRRTRRTECASLTSAGTSGDSDSYRSAISADGRFVAFLSFAGNLVPGDTNGTTDIFVRDRTLGTIERVSLGDSGQQANGNSDQPSLSGDGRFVAFYSGASNLVPGDTNHAEDVFVRDRENLVTELISVSSSGSIGNARSTWPYVSADGRCVVFTSASTNLVDGEQNLDWDVFVRDRLRGTTECVSRGLGGHAGNEESGAWGSAVSGDGRFVGFYSFASNLVPDDTNGRFDLFVRDREGGSSFTSLCDPGIDGVLPCPCGNPASASGRGCDNSAGTGGAALIASGGTYLSSDSLAFTTRGETPGALSVVFEASSPLPAGVAYGQGVRCVQGALRALYTKTAMNGGMRAPDFDVGEETVTARSAQKGDRISAGEHRWYFVSYRDPIVLGGCPAASTFNATQTGEVVWAP